MLDQHLIDAAIAQAIARFPNGEAGAAAVRLSDGRVLTSVAFDGPNAATSLCHETGAICEAYRLGATVTASACVSRLSTATPFIILAPCGVCQERLAQWGMDIQVAVPLSGEPTKWRSKTLAEVQPYYWRNVVADA
jgi:cytidine deaminase